MNRSEQVNELFAALSKAQAEIRGAVKDSANPFFKSKYADLESVWSVCREPLSKNGLCVVQTTQKDGEQLCVLTTLGHSSGQYITGSLPVYAIKQDPQGIGSAISYSRRYALAAMVGIYQTDDDGEHAMGRGKNGNGDVKVVEPKKTETKPIADNSTPSLADFVVQVGKKYKGKKLSEIPSDELASFVEWLGSQEKVDEKGQEFLKHAVEYLNGVN